MRPRITALLLTLLPAACASPRPGPEVEVAPSLRFLLERYDRDGDGRIARAEYTRSPRGFENLDADHDGWVSALDFDARWDGVPRVETFVWGEGGPEVGEPAPPIELPTTAGGTLRLDAFRGQKPVVLVFGSFT